MEESLKARLIGAVVLVALAVLLIPELLSGRKPVETVVEEGTGSRGTRTFTIELGQPSGRAPPSPAPSPGPASAAPASGTTATRAMAGAEAEQPAEPTGPAVASPETRLEPAPAQVPAAVAGAPQSTPDRGGASGNEPRAAPKPPPAASGGWAVQVGAFAATETARKLQSDLSGAGYRAFVSPVNRAGKTLYRVRVGPVGDRAGAEQLVPRLKARGLPATVVQND